MIDLGTKVLITTEFRGVFMGELAERDGTTVVLRDARNCIYWESSVRGFLGLASDGPSDRCRVGPVVERIELMRVTSITPCSEQAVERWGKAPWSS